MRLDQPLIFEPILKRTRWGSTRLGTHLNKLIGNGDDYAESWEVAECRGDCTVVADGPFQGMSLRSLVAEQGGDLFGVHAPQEQFPLLVKYLDVSDWLSLQVHPGDESARKVGATGKTEAWVVIACDPDSRLCLGLKEGVNRTTLESHLANGTVEDCLNFIDVNPGDCFYVPAGTVHAIGPGILLAEVQQQSDVTYRLFDWNRLDRTGTPRPLHIQQALECAVFDDSDAKHIAPIVVPDADHAFEGLIRCRHFCIDRHTIQGSTRFSLQNQFHIIMVLAGQGELSAGAFQQHLSPGATLLLPAACPGYDVSGNPEVVLLDTYLPDTAEAQAV